VRFAPPSEQAIHRRAVPSPRGILLWCFMGGRAPACAEAGSSRSSPRASPVR